MITLITLTQGNPIALQRTIKNVVESFQGMVNEVIVGDMSVFEDDRKAILDIEPCAGEIIQCKRLPFNHLFIHGFGATLNFLASYAMNNMILYLNVAEIVEKNLVSDLINTDYNCYKFNHATESHQWIRCYNRIQLEWSGRIHEEVVGVGKHKVRCSPGLLFQMADTEKDSDPYKAAIYNDIKELVYWQQYLKLIDAPEEIGATNEGWVNYARDSYQHIKDRLQAKGKRYEAFVEGDLQKYLDNCQEFEVPMSRPFTIVIPHYRTGKMTAYCIHQLNLLKGAHPINIIVVDNSNGEGVEYFKDAPNVKILTYPVGMAQSHGVAFDYALVNLHEEFTEYFITVESDSFPTAPNWLDYYERLINEGYEMAGSKLKLSGGEYIHPAGAMYKKENWKEAMALACKYYIMYNVVPNNGSRPDEPFQYHVMVKRGTRAFMEKESEKISGYMPVAESVFHNPMGFKQEYLATYGQRTIESEKNNILIPDNSEDVYYRMGYEPGQWFSYWHYATGKKVKQIPTLVKWMPGRENQQQEYTMMEENEFKHLWGVTAYNGCEAETLQDIIAFKAKQLEDHFQSIKG